MHLFFQVSTQFAFRINHFVLNQETEHDNYHQNSYLKIRYIMLFMYVWLYLSVPVIAYKFN